MKRCDFKYFKPNPLANLTSIKYLVIDNKKKLISFIYKSGGVCDGKSYRKLTINLILSKCIEIPECEAALL